MTLLPFKDNISLDINKISNFNLLKTTLKTSQPTQTSHACTFNIQFNTLKYRGQLLQDMQYHLYNKQVLNTKAKVSQVYQYGANLQAKDYKKLQLYKHCY